MSESLTPEWWTEKLYYDLALAAPEVWKVHILRRFEEATDAARAADSGLWDVANRTARGLHSVSHRGDFDLCGTLICQDARAALSPSTPDGEPA